MLLKKIKLENIRSYLNHEIDFPEGSVLLSGDIGSGKSSILLAIDFVLFGLRRGDLSGSMLLRNGKNNGSVELKFSVYNKEIIIKRCLKRTKDSVVQDSGFISIDGKKKDASAIELKQMILELLNYPQDLLTKSKPLVYHYTVYTPQEEMKHILYADNEIRLDTLRKVFGIDKYKRVNENCKILMSKLRELSRDLNLQIEDLPTLEREREDIFKNIQNIKQDLNEINIKKSEVDLKLKEIKDKFEQIDKKKKVLNELHTKLSLTELNLNSNVNLISNINKEIEKFNNEIKEIKKEDISILDSRELKVLVGSKEKEVNFMEDTLDKLNSKIKELEIKRENSNNLIVSLRKLDICSACKQKVSDEYKKSIFDREQLLQKEVIAELKIINENKFEGGSKLMDLKKELDMLKDKIREIQLMELKIKNLREKESSLEKLSNNSKMLKEEVGGLNSLKVDIKKQIDEFEGLEDEYKILNNNMTNLINNMNIFATKKGALDVQLKQLDEKFVDLNKKIENKKGLELQRNNILKLISWIDTDFLIVVASIERNIMLKIHHDFNNLFEKWFNTLVDTENLNVRLDEDFTPVIEQDGFRIEFEALSGGEKTAAALAYRLGLNQVINHVMGSLNTRDIIILDEPTDGFSEEQIDRMRIVLDELKLRQIIIVSHESKIESFVQNVIKINKRNHITEISY